MKRLDRVHQQSTSQDINTRLLLVTADVLLLSPLSINPSLGSIAGGAEIAYQRRRQGQGPLRRLSCANEIDALTDTTTFNIY